VNQDDILDAIVRDAAEAVTHPLATTRMAHNTADQDRVLCK